MKSHLLFCLAGAFALSHAAYAIDDTPENRAKEADRYLEATAPKEMLAEMVNAMAVAVPDGEKEKFKELLTKHFDYAAFTKSMKEAMTRHFTVTEIAALADFYATDVGKSSMKKMGAYTAEIMPLVQTEVLKAQQKALNEQGGIPAMPPGLGALGKGSVTPGPSTGAPSAAAPGAPPAPAAPGSPANPYATPGQPGQPTQPGAPLPFPTSVPPGAGGIPSSAPQVFPATKG